MTQPPAEDDGTPGATPDAPAGVVRRVELAELQIAKLWELFTKAARLDTSVEALRDEVRFLTSMWQQIQSNDEALAATRDEVHTVQSDARMARGMARAVAVVVAVLLAGVAVVGWGVHDVQDVARRQCVERQASLRATIDRERALARTDGPSSRAAHEQSAATLERLLHNC